VEYHCKAVDMKIGDKKAVAYCALTGRVEAEAAHPGNDGERAGKTHPDAVRVSEFARALAKLIGKVDLDAPDPARAAQVSILRNAVASGRYQPDLHDVARKLLAEVVAELAS